MQKIVIIAMIYFLGGTLIACNEETAGAPSILLKQNTPQADLSYSTDEGSDVRYTFRLGPYELPSEAPASQMLSKPASIKFNTDEVAWITSFEPKIEDAEGNPLLNELVHSIILVNHGEANVLCTTKQVGNPFAAATSLMNAIDLPEGYGYPVLPSDQLEAVAILKNPTSEKLQNVYIKIILRGKKNDGTAHFSDVRPLMMDVDPCEHKPMSIPPEKFVEKTMTGLVPDDGNIVAAHGFLQDYGVSASLTVNGEKEPFWQGIAEIDDEYHITALDHYEDAAGVPVKRGDELKFSIVYDNSGDGWYDEATGAAIVYLAADGAEKEIAATSGEDGETAAVPAADAQKAIIK